MIVSPVSLATAKVRSALLFLLSASQIFLPLNGWLFIVSMKVFFAPSYHLSVS